MTADTLPQNCPFELVGVVSATTISTDSGCVILADNGDSRSTLEDLLFDGAEHTHHDGGFAVNGHTIGTHVPYDGTFPVSLYSGGPFTTGLTISLQHIADTFHDMDDISNDENQAEPGEHAHPNVSGHSPTGGHGHGDHPEGWSPPQIIPVTSRVTILGDPAAILDGDTDATLAIRWPAETGYLMFCAHAQDGFRDTLAFSWVESD